MLFEPLAALCQAASGPARFALVSRRGQFFFTHFDAVVWRRRPGPDEVVPCCWRVGRSWRRTAASWPLALRLALGYTAGHVGIEGWRPFPPRKAADRLWYLTLAAGLLSLLDDWRSCPIWWLDAALGLWLSVVWLLLPPAIRTEGSRLEIAAWLVGLGSMGLLFWALLAFTAQRSPGVLLPPIFLMCRWARLACCIRDTVSS